MKIAIIGYGKMGHEIERVAKLKKMEVKSIIDPNNPEAMYSEINEESLEGVDVAIDFTMPSAVVENVRRVANLGKNMVVATTGWYEHLDEVKNIVEESGIGFIYSSNFSVGVAAYLKIIEAAAKLFDKIPDYDVYGFEAHHNQKIDSPSGTAKSIGDVLIKNLSRKDKLVFDKLDRKIEPNEVHIASIRAGFIPGTHVVGFDSEADTIELKHIARSRAGFAFGALMAAEWINGKKGFYTMSDFVSELLK